MEKHKRDGTWIYEDIAKISIKHEAPIDF